MMVTDVDIGSLVLGLVLGVALTLFFSLAYQPIISFIKERRG